MTIAEPTTRRWTRDEYYRMADMGLFQDQRVELIEGEVIQMAPQRDVHAAVVGLVFKAIARHLGPDAWIRMQLPLQLSGDSEPEPDVSVVRGTERDFIGTGHPKQALLVVEVSDSTLSFDQKVKSRLYAQNNIDEYWIVNLVERVVEVRRQPGGDSYRSTRVLRAGDSIQPLVVPHASISVADLLP